MSAAIRIFSIAMTIVSLIASLANLDVDYKASRNWFRTFIVFLALSSLSIGGVL